MNRKIFTYELCGAVFIIIVGSLLHFTFEFSGNQPIVGVFSAVNESVWEHLKLAFWPTLLFGLIEFLPLRRDANNFVFAKTAGVYLMVAVIPAIFYSYTTLTGESLLAVDVGSFVVAVVLGQLLSYKLLTTRQFRSGVKWVSLLFYVLLALLFVVFTFYPPQAPIFLDPVSGGYGVPSGN
ncbi:MAG: DUF6512 family protein [Candidatus Bathyarchaeia archaeon]|jgi:hypothetical protein